MNALRRGIDALLGWTICLLMAAMVLNVLWQVFTRFVLKHPSSFTEESARYMMIWLGLLGSAYAVGQKSHLALDLITARLEGASKRRSELFIHSIVLVFALTVLVGGGGRLSWIQLSLGQRSAALQMKLGYVYLALSLAGIFIAIYSVLAIVDTLRRRSDAAHPSSGLN